MPIQFYNAKSGASIREEIENAILKARAINDTIIVTLNDARFSVSPDTKLQKAISTYLEVKRKMFETEQLLKQKIK